jgi:cysteine synthase A
MASQRPEARKYLEEQGVQAAIADAVAQILRERPDNALARLSELLKPSATPPAATDDYLSTIGDTPMIKLSKMLPAESKAKAVYVKMEMQTPGGSIKDRIAKNIIETAEKEGKLKPGMTVVEATSGNTGIGLAMVSAAKGYKCVVIMPQVPPMAERYMIGRQFGADIILTAAGLGIKGCLKAYDELIASDPSKYFGANQFQNPANPEVHYRTTGPEVFAQTGGAVDIFVHGIGTGGTISGAGKFLKEKKPSCQVVAIEPSNARVHVGMPPAPHTIVGIGAGIPTHFLSMPTDGAGKPVPLSEPTPIPGVVDEWAHASQEEAIEFAKAACEKEGMMVGPSAGAALKVACDIATRPESAGKTVVVVCASHGIRYAAHPLWAAVKKEAEQALPKPPNMDKTIDCIQWDSRKM